MRSRLRLLGICLIPMAVGPLMGAEPKYQDADLVYDEAKVPSLTQHDHRFTK